MKNITTLLTSLLLIISTSAFAGDNADKTAKAAQKKTDAYVQVAGLNKDEQAQVYKILLDKEQKLSAAKEEHKGDKKAVKAAMKPFTASTNRQIKDIIGAEKMDKMNAHLKAKRAAAKKK